MRSPRKKYRLALIVALTVLTAGLPIFLAEPAKLPAAQPDEIESHSLCGEDHDLPYLDPTQISQEYKGYLDPKPQVVVSKPVDVTAVSKAAEMLIEKELADKKCRPRTGNCLRAGERWLCTYELQYEGIPLAKTTDAMCIIHSDGHALVFRKRNVPRKVDAIELTVKAATAADLGRDDFKKRTGEPKADATEPSLEIWVDGERCGRLCWTFTVTNGSVSKPKAARYWVLAADKPRVLAVENLIYHAHAGTVTGTVWATTPLQPTRTLPLPSLDVLCSKVGGRGRPTGLGGEYAFLPSWGPAKICATLAGPACVIEDYSGRPVLTRLGLGNGSGPINLDFDAKDELDIAQLTAFYWAGMARDFAKDFLSPSHLWQLKTRVNIDVSCNAVFSGADVSINFFQAGETCPNTAYSDIILHEYGHAIDFVHGGILDGGYSEGFGDAVAVLITRQPLIGRDLRGAGTFLRDARKIVSFPPKNSEPHFVAQVYAGFTWELIQQLQKHSKHHLNENAFDVARRLILAADAMNPKDIPDAVLLAFLADDDDGDLTNGSPHFAELAAAADSRKIPRPPDPAFADGPRCAYEGPLGAHHLVAKTGTAFYSWASSRRLATLSLEKVDQDYWYYCEKERPGFRWAFGRKETACGEFAVWFRPEVETAGRWSFFHFAPRMTPASDNRGR